MTVIPKDPLLVTCARRLQVADEPLPELRVELDRLRPFRVLVKSRSGKPVPDVWVQLVDLNGLRYNPTLPLDRPREAKWYREWNCVLLHEARTNALGYADMLGLSKGEEWMLRVVRERSSTFDIYHQKGLTLPQDGTALVIKLRN